MLKRVLFRAAAVAAAFVLGTGSARADFVDTFAAPATPVTGTVTGTGPTVVNTATVAPGLTRTTTVNQLNAGAFGLGTSFGIGGGLGFVLNAPADGRAFGVLSYQYTAPENLSSAGTTLQFTFSNNIASIPLSVTVTDAANNSFTQTGTANGDGVFAVSTGSFSGVSLASVSNITLNLNRNATIGDSSVTLDADFQLTDVRITTPTAPPVVPAPPAAVLVLAALPVLGLARVRRLLPV